MIFFLSPSVFSIQHNRNDVLRHSLLRPTTRGRYRTNSKTRIKTVLIRCTNTTGRSFRKKTKFHAVVSHGRGKRVRNRNETPSQQIFKKDYIYRGTFRHNRISGVMTALVVRGISNREELKGLKLPQSFRKIPNFI